MKELPSLSSGRSEYCSKYTETNLTDQNSHSQIEYRQE